jgi:two-component system cell cycle response regulator CpdR
MLLAENTLLMVGNERTPKVGVHGAVARMINILFVEDDSAVREVVTHVLAASGFGVFAAHDPYEAIRILAERHVDVLFTDIILPGMDGVQLAKQARVMRPAIKVLFTTGYAQLATTRDALRYGRVLYKPMRPGEIVQAIETAAA